MPSTTGNRVLQKMLDRLLAGLMTGPNINCRPHRSRQRVDLTLFTKFSDIAPEQMLRDLLGDERSAHIHARVKMPRKFNPAASREQPLIEEGAKEATKNPGEKAWLEQSGLLSKLRAIADDARTYENDTGVNALSVGFPLLSLPPGSFGGARGGTKRVLAPVAFIPVTVALKGGAAPGVELTCRADGVDRVRPNVALLSWLEQQTGVTPAAPLFEDEAGTDPWREITEVVAHVAKAAGVAMPEIFLPPAPTTTPSAIAADDSTAHAADEAEPVRQPSEAPAPISEIAPDSELPAPTAAETASGQSRDAESAASAPGVPAVSAAPAPPPTGIAALVLSATPGPDQDEAQPSLLLSAVLGLFPTAHQGLLRDMRAMIADSAAGVMPTGPIQSFLTAGIDFDAQANADIPPSAVVPPAPRTPAQDRLISSADPCQARAVAMARTAPALVIHGPPGTGKSQTITNIIADHLSRQQRVLLVCDKRTALDVVADRLSHMGLQKFCAIVHDPQRDQRELYKSIKQQLEDLPAAAQHPKAEALLSAADQQLANVHQELTAFNRALMTPPASGGQAFHSLMGQWLTVHSMLENQSVKSADLDSQLTDRIPAELLEVHRPALEEMLLRARETGYSKNPWTRCAGVTLADFLARSMTSIRTAMDRINAAAEAADRTVDPAIPVFTHRAPLRDQATARARLADRLVELAPRAAALGLAEITLRNPPQLKESQAWAVEKTGLLTAMQESRVDPELLPRLSPLPNVGEIDQKLGVLGEYQKISGQWTGMFSFSVKSAGKAVLSPLGLELSAWAASRAVDFFHAVKVRLLLAQHRASVAPTAAGFPDDAAITEFFNAFSEWVNLLNAISNDPALDGVLAVLQSAWAKRSKAAMTPMTPTASEAIAEVAGDPAPSAVETPMPGDPWQLFLQSLWKSPARAEAIAHAQQLLEAANLFDRKWLDVLGDDLFKGKAIGETASALAARLETLEGVLRVRTARAAMPAELAPVADALLARVIEPATAVALVRRAVLSNEITTRLRSDPLLQTIDDRRVDAAFTRYRELDLERKSRVRDLVEHHWVSRQKERLVSSTGSRLNTTGADLTRRLKLRGQNASRLRQVIAQGESASGGDPLLDLCPVWMASPETVAQIFPRKALFDVVIFDEASQCRLEEALPVLTRGKRVVIAGDAHQLPPTRFFESGVVQSEDEEATTEQELFEAQQGEIEDLLSAALSLAIGQCYLDVHYRSRNADLIEFSNQNFYSSRLQAIPGHPSNRAMVSPVRLIRADGIYNKRQNEAEADRVVALVRGLLEAEEPPSIGIACLNLPQRDLIVDKLEAMALEDAGFAKRLNTARTRVGEGSFEGLFVKNLENVQGDERDDIIISTTYGPDPKGKFYRRFGPLGMTGGGRRLNVLVTRARRQVHLVTSIPADAYRSLVKIPDGQSASGAWLLYAYLKYAEDLEQAYQPKPAMPASSAAVIPDGGLGAEAQGESSSTPLDVLDIKKPAPAAAATVVQRPTKSASQFARQLAEDLASVQKTGSDLYWGNDGFCVDLALHDPKNPQAITAGVLCDGCRYTGAEDPVEWDIFRTGILQDQGWKLHRVFSPHYFRDPQRINQSIAAMAAQSEG